MKRGDLSSELLERNILGPPSTVMLKRECLEHLGLFDDAIAFGVDYDLWIRIAQKYHFDFVPDIVARYTIHPRQMSNDPFIIARGRADIQRKYAPRLQHDLGREGRFYFWLGRQMSSLGHGVEARRAFLKALLFNLLQVRAYIHLAVSLAGPRTASRLRRLLSRVRGFGPADPRTLWAEAGIDQHVAFENERCECRSILLSDVDASLGHGVVRMAGASTNQIDRRRRQAPGTVQAARKLRARRLGRLPGRLGD